MRVRTDYLCSPMEFWSLARPYTSRADARGTTSGARGQRDLKGRTLEYPSYGTSAFGPSF
ncbi:hypothetical protein PPGU19_005610 [Paraburkholderia sp. PGU19]|nr:hypothetical protein PPGU19_005610 [Paraburkholderia sp. PGU19]